MPSLPHTWTLPRCFVFVIPLFPTTVPHQNCHPAHFTEGASEAPRAEETDTSLYLSGYRWVCLLVSDPRAHPSPAWEPQPCLEKAPQEGYSGCSGRAALARKGTQVHTGALN